MTAITRLYDSYGHAQGVLRDLKSAGISQSQISVVANPSAEGIEEETSNTTTGASVGAAVGGGAGLLAGLGLMAIPGAGPIVAAGWLVATLTGAVAGAASGGVIGALTEIGHSPEDAERYAEGLRRGGTLLSVRPDSSRWAEVEAIMDRSHGSLSGVESKPAPYPLTDVERERMRQAVSQQ